MPSASRKGLYQDHKDIKQRIPMKSIHKKSVYLVTMLFIIYLSGCSDAKFNGNKQLKDGAEANIKKVFEEDFSVTERKSIEYNLEDASISTSIVMKKEKGEHLKSVIQNKFEKKVVSFTQGFIGPEAVESFVQTTREESMLDILIVIDDSGSMKQEQENLGAKLDPLLSEINHADWQIGFATTDPTKGLDCMHELIRKGDQDIPSRFEQAINIGIGGSGNEKGIFKAIKSLNASCDGQAGWVRQGASLAVLIISDEPNCTTGCSAAGDKPADLLNTISSLGKNAGEDARVYGLIVVPGQVCATGHDNGGKGALQYQEVITATSGKSGSVCDADYTSTLNAISEDIGTILKPSFTLANLPDHEPKVFINTVDTRYEIAKCAVDPSNGTVVESVDCYIRTEKDMTFLPPPPVDSTVDIIYNYGGQEVVKLVELSEPLYLPAGVMVKVGDEFFESTDFTTSEDLESIEFVEAPEENSEIKIEYLIKAELNKSIVVAEQQIDKETLRVFQNGIELDKTDVSIITVENVTQINIVESALRPSTEEEEVSLVAIYSTADKVKLKYNVVLPDQLKEVKIQSTSTAINYTLEGSQIVFKEADFVDGQELRVVYNNVSTTSSSAVDQLNFPFVAVGPVTLETDLEGTCKKIEVVLDENSKVVQPSECDLSKAKKVILSGDVRTTLFERERELDLGFSIEVTKVTMLVDGEEVDVSSQVSTEVVDGKLKLKVIDESLFRLGTKVKFTVSHQVFEESLK